MNRFVLHIIVMLSVLSLHGQNLIYNGGFEEYYSCPVSNDLGNDQLELAKGWWKPTMGTSDYLNRCNNFDVGVPNNIFGHQDAHEGDAYAGLGIEWDTQGNYISFEYIACELPQPLKPCYEYRFKMYVCLAEVSSYGLVKLGASFNSEYEYVSSHDALTVQAQVMNFQFPLTDTTDWMELEGTFVAQGGEKYLTIGYFSATVQNDTTFIQNYPGNTRAAYYYIDNVSLYETGVSGKNCSNFEMKLPNIITANKDGINDVLDINHFTYLDPEVTIMNRWGNLVATLSKDNTIWDGGDCTEGIYYYLIGFPLETGLKQQNGFIQLVR